MKKNSRVRRWLAMILCMTLVLSSNVVSMAAEENGTEVQAVTEEPVIEETEPAAVDEAVPADITETEPTETPVTPVTETEPTGESETEPETKTETVTEPEKTEVPENQETTNPEEVEKPVTFAAPQAPQVQEGPGAGDATDDRIGVEASVLKSFDYPPYLSSQNQQVYSHLAKKDYDMRYDGNKWICCWFDDNRDNIAEVVGPRNKHYIVIDDTWDASNDPYKIAYMRCDMYGGEEQEKIYYPVFFIDEEGKTLLKEDNGRFWESVEKGKNPTKTPDKTNGYWTLGQYSGGLINKEEQLQQVTDTENKVDPSKAKITTQTVFIWHENPAETYKLEFTKVSEEKDTDGNYKPLKDAEFELFLNGESQGTATSGTDGTVTFADLAPDTYTLKETKAPDNYITPENTWSVTVGNDGSITIEGDNVEVDSAGKYKIINQLQKGTLAFTKIEKGGSALSGATFTLYDSEGEKTGYEDTSDADGQVTIENIPLGTYTMKETDAPGGYIQSTDTWVVEVTKDKVLLYLQGDESKAPVSVIENITEHQAMEDAVERDKKVEVVDEDNRTYKITLTADSTTKTPEITGKNASVVLILDESSSMDKDSFKNLKAAAKSFVKNLGEKAQGSEVAVMFFSDEAQCTKFYTLDKNGISTLNNYIENHSRKGGNTYMNRALAKADELLKNKTNEKYVVFFTDGEPQGPGEGQTAGQRTEDNTIANGARNAAARIKEYGTIFSVGYGDVKDAEFWWNPNDGNAIWNERWSDRTAKYYGWTYESATDYLSNRISSEGKYQYANTSAAITDIFNDIAGHIAEATNVEAHKIVDVIDSRFELADGEKERLQEKYGQDISFKELPDGSLKIAWTGKAAVIEPKPDSENPGAHGWKETINIQAKDDFVGGNMIPTNGSGSGIYVDEDDTIDVEFQKPTVNVKLLTVEAENKEKTVFLGDTITVTAFLQELLKGTKLNQVSGGTFSIPAGYVPSQDEIASLLQGSVVEKDYSYGSTNDTVGKFTYKFVPVKLQDTSVQDHEATVIGNGVEEYKLTVAYEASSVENRKSSLEGYISPEGAEQSKSTDDGIYTVNVIAGEIQITKKIDGNFQPKLEGDPIFTFKIEKLDEGDKVEKTWYRTVRFNKNTVKEQTVEALSGLEKGDYRVTELKSQRYTLDKNQTTTEGSTCTDTPYEDGDGVVFHIGTPSENDEVGARGVAKFVNTKTGDSGKRTDTDVRVNRFTKENGKWTWEGYDLSTSKPTSNQQ